MSITVTTDVFCDGCGNWINGVYTHNRAAITRARSVALRNGWKVVTDSTHLKRDYCPDCAAALDLPPAERPTTEEPSPFGESIEVDVQDLKRYLEQRGKKP